MALIDVLRKLAKKRAKTQHHFVVSVNAGTKDRERVLAIMDLLLSTGLFTSTRNPNNRKEFPEVEHLGIVIHNVDLDVSQLDPSEMLVSNDSNTRKLGLAIQKSNFSSYTSDT